MLIYRLANKLFGMKYIPLQRFPRDSGLHATSSVPVLVQDKVRMSLRRCKTHLDGLIEKTARLKEAAECFRRSLKQKGHSAVFLSGSTMAELVDPKILHETGKKFKKFLDAGRDVLENIPSGETVAMADFDRLALRMTDPRCFSNFVGGMLDLIERNDGEVSDVLISPTWEDKSIAGFSIGYTYKNTKPLTDGTNIWQPPPLRVVLRIGDGTSLSDPVCVAHRLNNIVMDFSDICEVDAYILGSTTDEKFDEDRGIPRWVDSEVMYFHPHVSNENAVCLGDDGQDRLVYFLMCGRITQAISVINTVLDTYNDENPYIELKDMQYRWMQDDFDMTDPKSWATYERELKSTEEIDASVDSADDTVALSITSRSIIHEIRGRRVKIAVAGSEITATTMEDGDQ